MIRSTVALIGALALALSLIAGANDGGGNNGTVEATSLLGRTLYALPDSDGLIAAAKTALAANPKDVALRLKLARAQAGKRQYREAITTCNDGLQYTPKNAELYLEKGHRELGLRDFQRGLADLREAVRLDPQNLDAQYHLGMAQYFLRDFKEAAAGFQRALDLAKTPDSVIDCSNWLYVSLQRAGEPERAVDVLKRIGPDLKNSEPHLFFYLRLLRFYQGKVSEKELLPPAPSGPSDIEGELSFNTVNYGVGNWHLYHGDRGSAEKFFRRVIAGYAWNSWGFIGSELELSRNPR